MANSELLSLIAVLLSSYTLYISFVSFESNSIFLFLDFTRSQLYPPQCIYNNQRSIRQHFYQAEKADDLVKADDSWHGALDVTSTDERMLKVIETRLNADKDGPSAVLELLQPLFANFLASPFKASNSSESTIFSQSLSCLYAKVLVRDVSTARTVLQLLERMKEFSITPSQCMFAVHVESLLLLRYYADAYQVSVDFVRLHPGIPESHAWMGLALSALDRTAEATPVLHVARVLVNRDYHFSVHDNFQLVKRMADGFYFLNETAAAEELYSRAVEVARASGSIHSADSMCDLLQPLSRAHLALNMSHLAYTELLQCVRDCSNDPENTVYLGTPIPYIRILLLNGTKSLRHIS